MIYIIVGSVLAGILLIGGGILGYCLYKKKKQQSNLNESTEDV